MARSTDPKVLGRINPAGSLAALCLRLAAGWWRSVLPLAASCGVLALVIGGAVGVGDAISSNLERRARARLGGISATVASGRFFDASLAARLAAAAGVPEGRLAPGVVLPLSLETTGTSVRGGRATLVSVEVPDTLGFAGTLPPLAADTVAISRSLARDLHVAVGDAVVIRVLERSTIHADSPLGRRVTGTRGRRVEIAAILPEEGLGGFSLAPSQEDAAVVVAGPETARRLIAGSADANVIFATADGRDDVAGSSELASRLAAAVRPTLRDFGLELEALGSGLVRLTSESLVLPPEADRVAEAVLSPLGGTPTMVLLANDITVLEGDEPATPRARVPYSTVAGVAATVLPFGRLLSIDGHPLAQPGPDEIIVDAWVADDLSRQGRPLREGSRLRLDFFAPETLHGRAVERSRILTVSGIARMAGAAAERSLVPEVEGITDKRSIANWEPPFPFDAARVRTTPPDDQDDRYWKDHGATPKAFVAIDTARQMAAGRFGRTTAWHLRLENTPADATTLHELEDRLAAELRPLAMGFEVRPVLAEALTAARGSTPFGGLFFALSSFVIVAAVALEWLLAGLLVATRHAVVGLLAAVGWGPRRVAALFGGIGAAAAVVGCAVGAVLGPAWASLLLALLERGFRGVEGAASRAFFAPAMPRATTILGAAAATFIVTVLAPWWAARRAAGVGVTRLLSGSGVLAARRSRPGPHVAAIASAAVILALVIAATAPPGSQQSGRFFAAGSLALAGMLGLVRAALRPGRVRSRAGLVRRGLVRQPGRTLSVIGIVSLAEFLIVAVSSFAVRPPADPRDRLGPTGGWTLIASLAEPCAADLSDRSQLDALGLSPDEQGALLSCDIAPIRVSRGDDASCLNLQKVVVPTVLGVGRSFRDRGGFRFLATRARAGTSPWHLLERPAGGRDGPVPALIDEATSRYAIGLSGVGARLQLPDERGEPVTFEVVGLLEPGILQGSLVVSEEDFLAIHPSVAGFRMVFVDVPLADMSEGGGSVEEARRGLERAVADFGGRVRTTSSRLASLGAVQNTFLAGFQALGTLGLVLGTAGLAAVQARALLERAREFGLLSAIGFTGPRVAGLVAAETLAMVATGLVIGAAAALVAVWPGLAFGRASPPLLWAAATSAVTLVSAWLVGRLVVGRLETMQPAEVMRAAE